ncbi:GNAT family N-acetyltransferase [Phytohabitans sp. LJ34]|uniref:GNAT family N-acetyltransferase n=1 Tax=Phytohabitans sp. LJ34 TaxID=3452217 RepID=UPI003F8A2170
MAGIPRPAAIRPPVRSVVSPAPRDEWRAAWAASTEATVFHLPEWLDAICAADGLEDASRLYETVDGARIVVPLVRRRALGPLRRRTSWSLPREWAGAFGTTPLAAQDVAAVLPDLLAASRRLVISPGPMTTVAWDRVSARRRVRHDVHLVDLRGGYAALHASLGQGTRYKIRKAEKDGVEVRWAPGPEQLGTYWELYLRWAAQRAKERGIPTALAVAAAKRRDSYRRFETIARLLGDRWQIAVARIGGEPAAAVIALVGHHHAHYWRATSDKDLVRARNRYLNYLLLARTLERAADAGCGYVHMGQSGGVVSLEQFKEHFRAEPSSFDELCFEPRVVTAAVRVRDRLSSGGQAAVLRAVKALHA